MFRSLAALAAATYLGAAHAAANMEDMSVAEVQQLLGDWELQAAFGDYFQRLRVDGDMLRHDLTPEHIDLAACPDASGAHVLKLFRKLKASAPVDASSASPAGAAAPARRSLASIGTGKSGISIARDDSMIALGVESDVMLSRTADGGMLLAPDVSVEGTLAVPTVDSLTVNGTATYFDETQSTHVFVGPDPVTLQQGILVTSTFTTGAEYELEFEINPYGTVTGWSNVMHFTATNENCCDYGERIPAMWMVSGTSKMMIVAGNNDTANAAYTMLTNLPQGQWTHFLVRVVDDAGEVFINGTMVGSISTDQRKPHDNVEVYMSDPWHATAKAKLRNVRYQRLAYHHSAMYNEFSPFDFVESTEQRVEDLEDLAIEHEETLETLETTYWQRIIEAVPAAEENWHTFVGPVAITAQSNVPATGTFTTGAEYELIFDVKPYGTVNNWNNLIHFTSTGENCCDYGDRIPAIWFYQDSTRLHIIAGSNSSGNGGFHPTTLLPTDSWTTVRLRLVNDTGLVYYNDVLMGTIDSDIRMPHDNTQVWFGDPWNLSPKAYLRNLKYRVISYHHSHFYDIATTADVDRILNPQ